MEELNFLSWMESFIKPRQSRGTYTSIKKREKEEPVFEDTLEPGESRGLLEENDDSNKVSGLTANQYPVQNVPIKMRQLVLKEKLTVIRLKT